MPIDYTIAAIPTVYKGIRYRSRLEAKWAAFFDQMGWEHAYEPADLGTWSPDFLIWSGEGKGLVEVKPIISFDKETATRMSLSARAAAFAGGLLLCGTAPFRLPEKPNHVAIGWYGGCDWTHWKIAGLKRNDVLQGWAAASNAVQWNAPA